MARGIMPLRGFDTALAALAAAHQAAKPAGYMPSGLTPLTEGRQVLTEADAKAALRDYGVAVPEGVVAATIDDALAFTRAHLAVMKIGAAAHKTEQDGVVLNIRGDDATRAAFDRLSADGPVLVEAMVDDAVGEVIVGVARDPVLGLHMIVGTGGIMAELTRDSSLIMMPFSRDDVAAALQGRMVKTLIDGFRGKPQGDEAALIDMIMAVQDFALAHEDRLDELDINPVLVRPRGHGVVAVDALIRYAT